MVRYKDGKIYKWIDKKKIDKQMDIYKDGQIDRQMDKKMYK